jgi:hypothetical protein
MNRPIGFMSIPKTAGNSICKFITDHLPPLRICPSPRLGVWDYRYHDVPGYDLYFGHFDHDFFDQIGAGALRLTMLRHPVSRMVSLYDFWRGFSSDEISAISAEIPDNGPLFASSVRLDAFVAAPTQFVKGYVENGMTRQLLGKSYKELLSSPSEMIDEAYRRLSAFDWVGITEHLDQSIASLADLLEFSPEVGIPKLNDSYAGRRISITRTRPTEQEIALVEHANFADIALYDRVANSFTARQPRRQDR